MYNVIGVQFRKNNKIYLFSSNGIIAKKGDNVIVETVRGKEFGTVATANKDIKEEEIKEPLKNVLAIASEEDKKHNEENIQKEKEAYSFMLNKIKEFGLEMKLVSCEYIFDNSKLLFYFTADNRIDFRDLVKDVASVYKTRIELRQIGARDEVKMLGECGMCGRKLCCNTFLPDFEPVSIKMAKEQGLSLSPTKISGLCGRLMCCLKYEHCVYEEKLEKLPKNGTVVDTPDGKGVVAGVEILAEKVKVKFGKDTDEITFKTFDLKDVKFTKKDNNEAKNKNENTNQGGENNGI